MALRRLLLLTVCATLALPGTGRAANGNYAFAGGTATERTQVTAALDASSFDWNLVPVRVTIHLEAGVDSHALPGQIWLDADLVDSGRFAWGPIQHEYAHQVDFFLLTPDERLSLAPILATSVWWSATQPHSSQGAERFASTLAWSYWPSRDNSLRPGSSADEAGAVSPARFRTLLARILPAPVASFAVRNIGDGGSSDPGLSKVCCLPTKGQ